jgi:hypothetical protein
MSASESEEGAPSSTDAEIIGQLKDKFKISVRVSTHFDNFTTQLECKKNRKIVWSIRLHG